MLSEIQSRRTPFTHHPDLLAHLVRYSLPKQLHCFRAPVTVKLLRVILVDKFLDAFLIVADALIFIELRSVTAIASSPSTSAPRLELGRLVRARL